jgi:hypothetical protein
MRRKPGVAWTLIFGTLGLAMIFLARSSLIVEPSLQASKYALLVVMQLLLLSVVLMTGRAERTDGARSGAASTPAS